MKYEYWLYDYNNVEDYSARVTLLLDNLPIAEENLITSDFWPVAGSDMC